MILLIEEIIEHVGFLQNKLLQYYMNVLQLGYKVNNCNDLRLWRADATETFDFFAFNNGDYLDQ